MSIGLSRVTTSSAFDRYDVFSDSGSLVAGYVGRMKTALDGLVGNPELVRLLEAVWGTLRSGHDLHIAGNGGGATTATHLATDLCLSMRECSTNRPCGSARSLTDNGGLVTAIANDECYESVYSTMLERIARPGDALLILSVSADSPNLVHACVTARARGITVLGVLGRPGEVVSYARVAVVIGGDSYGRAEDVQLSVSHILTSYVHQRHEEVHHD